MLAVPPSGIPTREEQSNLLVNVQEIFEELKTLVKEESNSTVSTMVDDVEKMVKRAQNHLVLIEEFTKLSTSRSNCNFLDFELQIRLFQNYHILRHKIPYPSSKRNRRWNN